MTTLSHRTLANAVRALSMDAIQTAQSGHPGVPMGMADIAEVLWRDYFKHNPANPHWVNRDRFVLSNGHGSMLHYALLHLSGYDLSIDDLKNFRQLHAKTAGHPEYGEAPGIETTTGPLGQGLANAVGMALTEKILAAHFNREGYPIVDHMTYVFLGDGCIMEGISHEVASLAGVIGLKKLVACYDCNGISIDGDVKGWLKDDIVGRFIAYNWHVRVIPNVDSYDADAIKMAFRIACNEYTRPTLICFNTTIGFGSPNKEGTAACHGAPLGDDEVALARERLHWHHPPFVIPPAVYAAWDGRDKGAAAESAWQKMFADYETAYPELAAEFKRRMAGELPRDFAKQTKVYIQQCQARAESVASRKASQNTLNAYGPLLPELLGGSADLTESNLTLWQGAKPIAPKQLDGNYIFYGVREFGMSAIMNGMALHGGVIPYGGTFLVFMDYARNAVRMAALMKQRSIFVYTHDSIGLGEDGPTHQPIEQLANLRMTPTMHTWRPCDTVETAVAWQQAIGRQDGPSALVFSRQTLPCMARNEQQLADIARGGYILQDCEGTPALILIATGSEVALAVQSAEKLTELGHRVRVVSMPATEVFDAQEPSYQQQVLPREITARLAIEAGAADFWYKYVGLDGRIIGMTTFGKSAPASDLLPYFGFTVANVVTVANELLLRACLEFHESAKDKAKNGAKAQLIDNK